MFLFLAFTGLICLYVSTMAICRGVIVPQPVPENMTTQRLKAYHDEYNMRLQELTSFRASLKSEMCEEDIPRSETSTQDISE